MKNSAELPQRSVRKNVVSVRLSDAEKRRLENDARGTEYSPSEYLRMLADVCLIVVKPDGQHAVIFRDDEEEWRQQQK